MSDLYTKESKTRTLSKMVPTWFNPTRRFLASLPEPALKWCCTARCWCVFPKAGALAGAPRAEQKARALLSQHTHPLIRKITGQRGDVVGLAGGRAEGTQVKVPSPGHAWGVRPTAPCFWPCLLSVLSTGAQPPWVHHTTADGTPARACPASPPPLEPPRPY